MSDLPEQASDVAKLKADFEESQRKAQLAAVAELTSKIYDKAIAYSNVIILAGYAGIFAIWSFTKDKMPDGLQVWIAFLTGISLSVFVAFEVVKMMIGAFASKGIAEIYRKHLLAGDFQAALDVHEKSQQRVMMTFLRFWYLSLIGSILPAVAAAALLFYALAIRLPLDHLIFW